MKLSGRALEVFHSLGGVHIVLSITHTRTIALAEVLIEAFKLRTAWVRFAWLKRGAQASLAVARDMPGEKCCFFCTQTTS